jgi:hypothetical protein
LALQPYVERCLRCTASTNAPLYLIGDETNSHYGQTIPGVNGPDHCSLKLVNEAREFERRFINHSSNPRRYELVCLLRGFHISALLENLSEAACIDLDSDCALLEDISSFAFDEPDAIHIYPDFANPLRMAASTHSARLTFDFLERYVSLVHSVYVLGEWPDIGRV